MLFHNLRQYSIYISNIKLCKCTYNLFHSGLTTNWMFTGSISTVLYLQILLFYLVWQMYLINSERHQANKFTQIIKITSYCYIIYSIKHNFILQSVYINYLCILILYIIIHIYLYILYKNVSFKLLYSNVNYNYNYS